MYSHLHALLTIRSARLTKNVHGVSALPHYISFIKWDASACACICDSRRPFYLAYQVSSRILLWIMLKVSARCLSTFPRQPSRHHPCPLDVSLLSQPLPPLFYNLQRPATSSSVVGVLGGVLSSLHVSSLAYTLLAAYTMLGVFCHLRWMMSRRSRGRE
ncbi:hypothetical protein P691DRAFT_811581 [Macrolepiota fuliginosa MF-IS2]|uniref:Uncharacterized protein n=1 Tax=Macrolepiota fuliginosa MF-IS2 TaxID=1400762 RepID=A0A9P5X243_9AGAR|nr:hypothetical protein P691DRAFT_811581 [Macrolepiota fuliginosa MF-IS2]